MPLAAHSIAHCVHAPLSSIHPCTCGGQQNVILAEPLAFVLETGECHEHDDAYRAFVADFGCLCPAALVLIITLCSL